MEGPREAASPDKLETPGWCWLIHSNKASFWLKQRTFNKDVLWWPRW